MFAPAALDRLVHHSACIVLRPFVTYYLVDSGGIHHLPSVPTWRLAELQPAVGHSRSNAGRRPFQASAKPLLHPAILAPHVVSPRAEEASEPKEKL